MEKITDYGLNSCIERPKLKNKEGVNEANVQYVGVVLDLLKPRVSCQISLLEKNKERAHFDLQS
jgi:hypothetical protein